MFFTSDYGVVGVWNCLIVSYLGMLFCTLIRCLIDLKYEEQAGDGLLLTNPSMWIGTGSLLYISNHIQNTDFNGLRLMNPLEWIYTGQLILY